MCAHVLSTCVISMKTYFICFFCLKEMVLERKGKKGRGERGCEKKKERERRREKETRVYS